MKISGLSKKLGNLNTMNVPCSSEEFSKLRDGETIEADNIIANKLLAMGLVKKVRSKKSKGEK